MHRVRGKNATEGKIQGDRAIQRIEDSIIVTVQLETGPEITEQRKRDRLGSSSRCDLHSLENLPVAFSPAAFTICPVRRAEMPL